MGLYTLYILIQYESGIQRDIIDLKMWIFTKVRLSVVHGPPIPFGRGRARVCAS